MSSRPQTRAAPANDFGGCLLNAACVAWLCVGCICRLHVFCISVPVRVNAARKAHSVFGWSLHLCAHLLLCRFCASSCLGRRVSPMIFSMANKRRPPRVRVLCFSTSSILSISMCVYVFAVQVCERRCPGRIIAKGTTVVVLFCYSPDPLGTSAQTHTGRRKTAYANRT